MTFEFLRYSGYILQVRCMDNSKILLTSNFFGIMYTKNYSNQFTCDRVIPKVMVAFLRHGVDLVLFHFSLRQLKSENRQLLTFYVVNI